MQRTPHGFTHGEAPGGPPFIVIKLKTGWALEPGGTRLKAGARRAAPELPAGAELVPALPVQPQARGKASPAERELARFVHLRLPDGAPVGEALALARGWAFVERADLPPAISLP